MTEDDLVEKCIRFAARFGFLTREIFCRHLFPKSRAQQFKCWRMLTAERWFEAAARDPHVLYLAVKSRSRLTEPPVKAVPSLFIEHDSRVTDLLLTAEREVAIERTWTEMELSRQRWESYSILGTARISKLPDLILDLKAPEKPVRIAVEIELNLKSKARYAHIALSYLDMNRLDLILYGCATQAIAREIRRAFSGAAFDQQSSSLAIFQMDDFHRYGLEAPVLGAETSITLRQLLQRPQECSKYSVGASETSVSFVS